MAARLSLLLMLMAHSNAAAGQRPPSGWVKYEDPSGRFQFLYPSSFGVPGPGTNNGFGDRIAAIRFSQFSSGMQGGTLVLGGEATLTRGWVHIDLQAAGGLYDSITLEALPDAMRANIVASLLPLSAENFCELLGKQQHIDPAGPRLAALTPQQKTAVLGLDQIRNVSPKILRCERSDDVIVFHKEAAWSAAQPENRQHVYGAVRFLKGAFSSFQIVRATAAPPSDETLTTIRDVVKSFR